MIEELANNFAVPESSYTVTQNKWLIYFKHNFIAVLNFKKYIK